MNYEIAFNSLVCGVAVIAASYAPVRERKAAVICAAALFPIWAIYTLSFDREYSLAIRLTPLIGSTQSKDVWATLDLFGGMVALLVAWRFWWGRALFLSFLFEATAHNLRWDVKALDRQAYYWVLDINFYAQGALFIAIGGRGCVEFLAGCLGAGRGIFRMGRPVAPAQSVARRD